jgi:hypothetical protein
MVNFIYLNLRLRTIEEFFNRVVKEVDAEVSNIHLREEAEEFTELDDFDNALFYSLETEAIAIKAVFYEINALIENELQGISLEAYSEHPKYIKKRLLPDITSIEEISKVRFINELQYNEICVLIEEYYGLALKDLPSFEYAQFIRQSVNLFKHNNGFKSIRQCINSKFQDKLELKRDDAYKAISEARIFLVALSKKIDNNLKKN